MFTLFKKKSWKWGTILVKIDGKNIFLRHDKTVFGLS